MTKKKKTDDESVIDDEVVPESEDVLAAETAETAETDQSKASDIRELSPSPLSALLADDIELLHMLERSLAGKAGRTGWNDECANALTKLQTSLTWLERGESRARREGK